MSLPPKVADALERSRHPKPDVIDLHVVSIDEAGNKTHKVVRSRRAPDIEVEVFADELPFIEIGTRLKVVGLNYRERMVTLVFETQKVVAP